MFGKNGEPLLVFGTIDELEEGLVVDSPIFVLLFGKEGSIAPATTKGKKKIDKTNPSKIFLLIFPPSIVLILN